jgi:hypothetical protein
MVAANGVVRTTIVALLTYYPHKTVRWYANKGNLNVNSVHSCLRDLENLKFVKRGLKNPDVPHNSTNNQFVWYLIVDASKIFKYKIKHCLNCGKKKVVAKERCSACYKWWKYKGEERPRRLWDLDAICENKNCKRPLNRVKRRYKSLCNECTLYWSLTGEYRPRKYCNKRWCDCGEIAVHEVQLEIAVMTKFDNLRQRKETFWLCEQCYQDEKENG